METMENRGRTGIGGRIQELRPYIYIVFSGLLMVLFFLVMLPRI